MEAQTKKVLGLAQQLPLREQEELLAELVAGLSTLDESVERAWAEEAARRWARFQSGETETVPWADVRRGLTEQLGI
jgi:hypothetical protein